MSRPVSVHATVECDAGALADLLVRCLVVAENGDDAVAFPLNTGHPVDRAAEGIMDRGPRSAS